MDQLEPYLFFNGDCADAMRFYEQALGGEIQMMMKASEAPVPSEHAASRPDGILHAALSFGGHRLLASDWMAQEPFPGQRGVSIAIGYPMVEDAKRAFEALVVGGKVDMPMEKTFWIESFGMLTDKFGTHWMVSGGKPAEMPNTNR